MKVKVRKIINLFLIFIFTLITFSLIINIIKLSNIENLLRASIIIVLSILVVILSIFINKKTITCRILIIILSSIYLFLNYNFYRIYNSLENITTIIDTKTICLVTNNNDITELSNITADKIAILNSNLDKELNQFALDVINREGLDNLLVEYDGYLEIINALLNKEVMYAFLPENYNDIYNNSNTTEDPVNLSFNILYKDQKVIEQENAPVNLKDVNEPFTILLMGTDIILDSYNADTLLLMTINPKTLNITMLSIPRDTYATIACTGGKHKINASGWYGDKCVVKTVEKYLDIEINYYAKINFIGIVELVDKLGGIEVDVPYALCEQNSQRQFGDHIIYIDEGHQTLNGEQALALSRNRHYWKGLCPEKYTKDGNRSDITRGQNQQLVIRGILNKLITIRDLNALYDILDTIGNNMTTNMSKENILSFYNLGKEIVKKLHSNTIEEIVNINRLGFKSYSPTIFLSGLSLSTIVNYDESIDYVSKKMKENLGLLKKEEIKNFSFDINIPQTEDTIKYKSLTTKLQLLPSFVGKSITEALNYCTQHKLKCEKSITTNGEVILTQSIPANSDLTTIKNKTIIFETENYVKDESNLEKDDSLDDVQNNESPNKEDDNQNETTEDDTPPTNDDTNDNNNQQAPNIPNEEPEEEVKKEDNNEEEEKNT